MMGMFNYCRVVFYIRYFKQEIQSEIQVIKNVYSCENWYVLGIENDRVQQVVFEYDVRYIFVVKVFLMI